MKKYYPMGPFVRNQFSIHLSKLLSLSHKEAVAHIPKSAFNKITFYRATFDGIQLYAFEYSDQHLHETMIFGIAQMKYLNLRIFQNSLEKLHFIV